MKVRHKIGLAMSAAAMLLGLILGLTPQTVDSGSVSEVGCGSPFFPDSSPSGNDTTETWADILGYESTSGLNDSRFLSSICDIYLSSERTAGLVFVGAGLVGGLLVWLSVRRNKVTGAANAGPATSGQTPSADLEAHWRAQGYVPSEEIQGPPPGWTKLRPDDYRAP